MNTQSIIVQYWPEIQNEIVSKFNQFKENFGYIDISNKTTSELFSAIVETSFNTVLKEKQIDVVTPKKDSEPDMYIQEEAVEIKATNGEQWRGGAFSKRPGLYILVSWDYSEKTGTKLFAAMQNMEKSDWFSSKLDENGNFLEDAKYYATTYGKKDLVKDEKYKILSGDIVVNKYKKNGEPRKTQTIKLVKE